MDKIIHPRYAFDFPLPIEASNRFHFGIHGQYMTVLFFGGGLAIKESLMVVIKEKGIEAMIDKQLIKFN